MCFTPTDDWTTIGLAASNVVQSINETSRSESADVRDVRTRRNSHYCYADFSLLLAIAARIDHICSEPPMLLKRMSLFSLLRRQQPEIYRNADRANLLSQASAESSEEDFQNAASKFSF